VAAVTGVVSLAADGRDGTQEVGPASPSACTVTVAVAELAGVSSPVREIDEAWVATLAAAGPPFAPVVVTAPPDGALVDGAHRVRAAIALGLATLPAVSWSPSLRWRSSPQRFARIANR
jgi:hypothetical protein